MEALGGIGAAPPGNKRQFSGASPSPARGYGRFTPPGPFPLEVAHVEAKTLIQNIVWDEVR